MDLIQTLGPLFGGSLIVIWMGWRLFWKIDRRSQYELAIKDRAVVLTWQQEAENAVNIEGLTPKDKEWLATQLLVANIKIPISLVKNENVLL